MLTKKTLRAAYIDRVKTTYPWASDEQKLANFCTTLDRTFAGSTELSIYGFQFTECWRDLGGKGKPTYKALHALPEE
jgi:hypothetical protein